MRSFLNRLKAINWRWTLCLLGFAIACVSAVRQGRLIWADGLFLPPSVLILAILLVMLPLLFAIYHGTRAGNGEKWKRIVISAGFYFAFACYLFQLYCFLFAGGRADYDYSYNPANWIPLRKFFVCFVNGDSFGSMTYLALSYLKNAALFIPLGFMLPYTCKRMKNLGLVAFVSLLLILAVELTQHWTHTGFFDMDDVIFNLLGVVCGFGIARLHIVKEILRFLANIQRRRFGVKRSESGRNFGQVEHHNP